MRSLLSLLVWMLLGVALGALVAPWAYVGGTLLGDAAGIDVLRDAPFGRYLNRCLLGAVGGALCLLMWRSGGLSRAALGWGPARRGEIWRGIEAAGILAALALVALWLGGGYVLERRFSLAMLAAGVGTGLAVGVIEETFFRGALMHSLRSATVARIALWGQALVYAFVHFWHAPPYTRGDEVTWLSGLSLLPHYFQFNSLADATAAWVVLVALGVLLGLLRTRDSILPSVACHAIVVSVAWVGDRMADGPADLWWDKDFRFGLMPALIVSGVAAWHLWLGSKSARGDDR